MSNKTAEDYDIKKKTISDETEANKGYAFDKDIGIVILGDIAKVKTISGDVKNLNIPAGTQHEEALRIKGAGVKNGDHVVIAKIKIPENLSTKEKDLIEEFQKIRKDQ